jgi:hypothetical protein
MLPFHRTGYQLQQGDWLKEAVNCGLWHHLDIARRALKAGTKPGWNKLETIRNAVNGWYVGFALG